MVEKLGLMSFLHSGPISGNHMLFCDLPQECTLSPNTRSPGLPRWLSGKESTCQGRSWRCRFDPWVRKVPWRRKWQPSPVFLPGKSHEQRSLAGYSPWGLKSRAQLSDQTTIYKVSDKDLLYSTGNSTEHLAITYNGKESEKEYAYTCMCLYFAVHRNKRSNVN